MFVFMFQHSQTRAAPNVRRPPVDLRGPLLLRRHLSDSQRRAGSAVRAQRAEGDGGDFLKLIASSWCAD